MQSKERPMLFSSEMVNAILEGRKTTTRRIVDKNMPGDWNLESCNKTSAVFFYNPISKVRIPNPYGQPGDILWVREKFRYCQPFGCESLNYQYADETIGEAVNPDIHYRIDDYERWRPSIHMPKVAARIWLQITDIRVERVQEISAKESIAEGIEKEDTIWGPVYRTRYDELSYISPQQSFCGLWTRINGIHSWDINPWVWVISFKVLSKTGKPWPEKISGFESKTLLGERLKSSPSGIVQKQVDEASLLPGNGEGKEYHEAKQNSKWKQQSNKS